MRQTSPNLFWFPQPGTDMNICISYASKQGLSLMMHVVHALGQDPNKKITLFKWIIAKGHFSKEPDNHPSHITFLDITVPVLQ